MSAQQVISLLKEAEYVDYDDVSEILSNERGFLEELLAFYNQNNQNEEESRNLLDLLRRFHWDEPLTKTLKTIVNDSGQDLSSAAIKVLGFVDPLSLFELVKLSVASGTFDGSNEAYQVGFELASEELSAQYYGEMDGSQFDVLEENKEALEEEYKRYHQLYTPIRPNIQASDTLDVLDGILETFEELATKHGIAKL